MLSCNKRQKIVKRAANEITYRCMNKECGFHGGKVDEGICSRCPVRSVAHKKPCADSKLRRGESKKSNPNVITTEEMLEIDTEEIREMVKDAGLDLEEFDKATEAEGTPEYPALSMQVWLYKEALLRWNKAGRPKRTDEEVENILNTHCKNCDWYDPDKKRCRGCGCRVTESSIAAVNKIRMATEHCPKELW